MDIQFVHQVLTVLLHRLDTDTEHVGHHFVGMTFRDELNDFRLPRCQSGLELPFPCPVGPLIILFKAFNNRGTEEFVSNADLTNGLGERLR